MKKYKVGITFGVFDLLHIGHLNLLERCKSMCDKLIVAICDDDYVVNVKNKKPVYSEQDRVRILKALKVVDDVVLVNKEETANKLLVFEKMEYDVLFSGDDWKGSDRYKKTEEEFANYGISIEYFPYTTGISSSEIKDKLNKE